MDKTLQKIYDLKKHNSQEAIYKQTLAACQVTEPNEKKQTSQTQIGIKTNAPSIWGKEQTDDNTLDTAVLKLLKIDR